MRNYCDMKIEIMCVSISKQITENITSNPTMLIFWCRIYRVLVICRGRYKKHSDIIAVNVTNANINKFNTHRIYVHGIDPLYITRITPYLQRRTDSGRFRCINLLVSDLLEWLDNAATVLNHAV